MSQIDQAFIKAYSKDRGRHASNAASAPPAAAPMTSPVTRITSSGPAGSPLQNLFAHAPSPIAAPHTEIPVVQAHTGFQSPSPLPTPSPKKNAASVGTSQMASRERSSSTVRVDNSHNESSIQTTRKTLTSYFQQSRADVSSESGEQATASPIPTVATRWSPPASPVAAAATPSPLQSSRQTLPSPQTQPQSPPPSNVRYESVDRGQEFDAWQFQVVERGVKSNSTSDGPSARLRNPGKPGSFLRVDPSHREPSVTSPTPQPTAKFAAPVNPFTRPIEYVPAVEEPAIIDPWEMESDAGQALPVTRGPLREQPPVTYNPPPKQPNNKPLVESIAKLSLPVQPTWEVDSFLWPSAVAGLNESQPDAIRDIGLHLQHASSKGLRTLAVTSGERGVGRSTVSMCLAKAVSKAGLRVALVDCDYECPSLVDQLNLDVTHGWQDCILDNVPLDEVAVYSISEKITFFPLLAAWSNSQISTHQLRINKLLKRISIGYDLVILDCNRLNGKQQTLFGLGEESVIDAALVIVDAQLSLRQRVDGAIETLRRNNIQSIGLAENFHSQG